MQPQAPAPAERPAPLGDRLRRFAFPLVAFAVWRALHAVALWATGGSYFGWDGNWYHRILDDGYKPVEGLWQQSVNFFPLLPWVTKPIELVVRSDLAAAVMTTTVIGGVATVLVYAVVVRWRDEATARLATLLFLAFPGSMFLWAFYAEGLLVALSAGAVLAWERERHGVAALCCTAAVMAKPIALLVPVALAVLTLLRGPRRDRRVLLYVGALAGLLPVMWVQHVQYGDGLAWLSSQEAWGRDLSWPVDPLIRGLRAGSVGEGWSVSDGRPVDAIAAIGFLALAVASIRGRWPVMAPLLIAAAVLPPLFTGSVTSSVRYVVLAWPAFAVAAGMLRRYPVMPWVTVGCLGATQLFFVTQWSQGYFVG